MDKIQHFDFPTWSDIENKATEILGTVTNNPVAVINSQTAQAANEALKKAGIDKQVTAKDIVVSSDPIKAAQQKADISKSVSEGLADFPSKILGNFKWILIIIFVVILIAVFYRVSGK